MGVRTETVQFHSCDLRERDCDEADLTLLYGPLVSGKRAQADECPACQKRPIAELVDWLSAKQQGGALRPLRSLRGVGR